MGVRSSMRRSDIPGYAANAGLGAAFAALLATLAFALGQPEPNAVAGSSGLRAIIQVDIVSISMLLLVNFVGAIVLRYARTYLDGEARQDSFMGWVSLTLASVSILVVSANLIVFVIAWIATSVFLHQLLLFYPQRIAARRAAFKKFVFARAGDAALIGAAVLLWSTYNTIDISTINAAARLGEADTKITIAAILFALAAILKSAQFPTHSWLTEIMDTPTPTSALLHAGVVNGGGFLLIRFADVLLLSPGTMAFIAMIGGFTALFGSVVMLTQPAVKTSLAWSTVAQMGFLIMQCGLALFPLALLHIIAHSLYKAHAFLASGGAVQRIANTRRPGPVAIANLRTVTLSFLLAITIYGLLAFGFGLTKEAPQSIALGAILIFGIAYLLTQGLAEEAPKPLTRRLVAYSIAASLSYVLLHKGAIWLTHDVLPITPAPGALEWVLMIMAVLSFAFVAFAQAMFPLWAYHPAAAGMRVHVSNGLYVNALLDRIMKSWRSSSKSITQQ
ncbi:MAG: proton-conducting transporter membrane subunit [Pseudomonadota bacterium]